MFDEQLIRPWKQESHHEPELSGDDFPPLKHPLEELANPVLPAAPWVMGSAGPRFPVQNEANIRVYDAWVNEETANHARHYLEQHPEATLPEVQRALIIACAQDTPTSAIWWLTRAHLYTKALYRDAVGLPFIRYEKHWLLARSISAMGCLVAVHHQGSPDTVKRPRDGYFVCWESEAMARMDYKERRMLMRQDRNG